MQQLSGAEFDQAYMDEMVKDHEKDIAAFEQQAQAGQDPELRAFAEEALPTLREHLELAERDPVADCGSARRRLGAEAGRQIYNSSSGGRLQYPRKEQWSTRAGGLMPARFL